MKSIDRRGFIKASVLAGAATSFFGPFDIISSAPELKSSKPSVAISAGGNRADLAFRALQPYSKQIKQAIGNKRVVLKPNMVSTEVPACATHVETLEGILEFLKSINNHIRKYKLHENIEQQLIWMKPVV